MHKDDLGVEYDDTVAEALKDPKSSVIKSVIDYFLRRGEAERKKAQEEEDLKKKNEKPKGVFDSLLS